MVRKKCSVFDMVDEMNRVSEANTEFFDSAGPEDHRGS